MHPSTWSLPPGGPWWSPHKPAYTISRRAYSFAVLEQLQTGLKRHDVFVSPQPEMGRSSCQVATAGSMENAATTGLPQLGSIHPTWRQSWATLRQQLDASYRRTAENLTTNPFVRMERQNGKDTLTISPIVKLDTPPSLALLRSAIAGNLPLADLPDVILEVHRWTGFLDEFTHINESTARVDNLVTSLCAVLVAEACNIGLEPVIRPDNPGPHP